MLHAVADSGGAAQCHWEVGDGGGGVRRVQGGQKGFLLHLKSRKLFEQGRKLCANVVVHVRACVFYCIQNAFFEPLNLKA